MVAGLGDEVAVLQDDQRRLEHPGQGAGGPDGVDARPGQHDDRELGEVREEIPEGVGLAGAGRAVQQQSAPQVLTGRAQAGTAPGHAHDLSLHALQQPVGEHDVVAGQSGPAVEAERSEAVAELRALEGEDLAPEDVEFAHEGVDLGEQPVGELLLPGQHLDLHLVATVLVLRAAQQDGEPLVALRPEIEPAGDAGEFRVGRDGQLGVVDGADGEPVVAVGRFEDVAEGQLPVVLGTPHTDELVRPSGPLEPALQGEMHIGQVVRRIGGLDHGPVARGGAQVLPEPLGEIAAAVTVPPLRPGHRHQELLEQLTDLLHGQRGRLPSGPVPRLVLVRAHDLDVL